MGPSMRPTGLRLTLLLVALGAVTAEDVAAKCSPVLEVPGLARGVPVIVDGSLVSVAAPGDLSLFDDIDPDVVRSIGIICWNPTTGEFTGSGINVIAIRTVSFLQSTRAPLEQLLTAQDAHFAAHSRYARSLDALIDFGGPRDAMLEFSATSDGWSAATPQENPAYRCAVYSDSATPVVAYMTAGKVACEVVDRGASRAIREWYEAL